MFYCTTRESSFLEHIRIKCTIKKVNSFLHFFIYVLKMDKLINLTFFLLIAASIIIFIFSPIENINKPLSEKQKILFKRTSRLIVVISLIVTSIVYITHKKYINNNYFFSFVSGFVLEAIALILSIIERRASHETI